MPPSTPANLGAVALVSVTLCSVHEVHTRKLVMIADERFVFGTILDAMSAWIANLD